MRFHSNKTDNSLDSSSRTYCGSARFLFRTEEYSYACFVKAKKSDREIVQDKNEHKEVIGGIKADSAVNQEQGSGKSVFITRLIKV